MFSLTNKIPTPTCSKALFSVNLLRWLKPRASGILHTLPALTSSASRLVLIVAFMTAQQMPLSLRYKPNRLIWSATLDVGILFTVTIWPENAAACGWIRATVLGKSKYGLTSTVFAVWTSQAIRKRSIASASQLGHRASATLIKRSHKNSLTETIHAL